MASTPDTPRIGRVVVVGSLNVDLVARVPRLPAPGQTVTGGTFAWSHGGKGANQAVAAARFGAEVHFVGAVGDDEIGRRAIAALVADGIDASGVATLVGVMTGVALVVVDERGENQIAVASGANHELDERHVINAMSRLTIDRDTIVLLGFEIGDTPLLGAARFARRHGARLLVNPAPARPLTRELIALSPILTPNAGELDTLLEDPQPLGASNASAGHDGHAAQRLSHLTGQPVIVTLGEHGVLVAERSTSVHLPALRVDVVDSTGAGDAFTGVLAAALATGEQLTSAVGQASAAAGLSVTAAGARHGLPSRTDVIALLGGNEGDNRGWCRRP